MTEAGGLNGCVDVTDGAICNDCHNARRFYVASIIFTNVRFVPNTVNLCVTEYVTNDNDFEDTVDVEFAVEQSFQRQICDCIHQRIGDFIIKFAVLITVFIPDVFIGDLVVCALTEVHNIADVHCAQNSIEIKLIFKEIRERNVGNFAIERAYFFSCLIVGPVVTVRFAFHKADLRHIHNVAKVCATKESINLELILTVFFADDHVERLITKDSAYVRIIAKHVQSFKSVDESCVAEAFIPCEHILALGIEIDEITNLLALENSHECFVATLTCLASKRIQTNVHDLCSVCLKQIESCHCACCNVNERRCRGGIIFDDANNNTKVNAVDKLIDCNRRLAAVHINDVTEGVSFKDMFCLHFFKRGLEVTEYAFCERIDFNVCKNTAIVDADLSVCKR